jgi:hypothetical protein
MMAAKSLSSADVLATRSHQLCGKFQRNTPLESRTNGLVEFPFSRFHGKELVKEGGRYHITLEKDQKLYHMARLEIANVVTGDKGEYRAVAKNKHGEGVATINLNFEGGGNQPK